MNPYARFSIISNFVSASVLVAGLAVFAGPLFEAVKATTGGAGPAMWAAAGVGVVVLVVFWQAMTEAIFPTLFRFNSVRRMILGKYYAEGTWLQAERGAHTGNRMSVIDIQPDGKGFIFSGYSLNEDLEIETSTLIELSKFDWPFMTYKYRNTLSEETGERDGVGEIQFEMNRSSAQRYNGFIQTVSGGPRLKIEGNKLTSNSEVKRLRTLDGRHKVFEKYWELFFNRKVSVAATARKASPKPVIVEEASFTERRDPFRTTDIDTPIVPRRRASDWRQDEDQAELDSIVDEIKATGTHKS